nr:MAG TPA: baseplate assembly protein [Caudoviricetes sp.]
MKKDTRNWQVSLNDSSAIVEGANDIAQCVYIILTTIPGSDPLRPDFGSNIFQYMDKPIRTVQAAIVYAATEALKKWETRIEVTKCYVSENDPQGLTLIVEAVMVNSATQITIPIKL